MWFKCFTCCLDACLSSHLVAFSSYVFFPLEKPLFCILNSFSIDTFSIEISRFDLDNFSTDRLIHWAKILCSLSTQHILDRFSIHRGWLLLDRFLTPPRSIKIPLHAFHFFCFAFFSFVSIASCFSFSCRSIVPFSPRSLYISFLSVSGQVFWPFMPFDNHVKNGENFEI